MSIHVLYYAIIDKDLLFEYQTVRLNNCMCAYNLNADIIQPRVYNKERGRVSYSVCHCANTLRIIKTQSALTSCVKSTAPFVFHFSHCSWGESIQTIS